jgi:hypothetical protein
MTDTTAKDKLINWYEKLDFLNNSLEKLELLKDLPIFAIATFLIKSQLVEFQLKQIISNLDLVMTLNNRSEKFSKKRRRIEDLEGYTLGRLISEFKQYTGALEIASLINDLEILLKKRNSFTHELFDSSTDIQALIREADEGLDTVNRVLDSLKVLERMIDEEIQSS